MKNLIIVLLTVIGLYTIGTYVYGVAENFEEERNEKANWTQLVYIETQSGSSTVVEYFVPTYHIFEVSMDDSFKKVNAGIKAVATDIEKSVAMSSVKAEEL